MRRAFIGIISPLVVLPLIIGCAATKITSVWKDPTYQTKPKKALTVAVLKTATNRLILEDEFSAGLRQRGVDAIAGHTVLSEEDKPVDKEALQSFLRDSDFDSLFLLRLVDQRSQQTYVPGAAYPVGSAWPGYYGGWYDTMYTPGYVVEDQYAIAETNLYDVKTQKLMWTAATETWMKASNQELIKEYVGIMMRELEKQGILK